MENEVTSKELLPPRRRRKLRNWLIPAVLLVTLGSLAWLNGPGFRWLAPQVAAHFLGKSGVRCSFAVEGSLLGGFLVRDLKLTSDGTLAGVSARQVKPLYQFPELLRGRVLGIEIDDAHLELRLGMASEVTRPAPELEEIVQSVRQMRERVLPYSIAVRGFSLAATREETRVVSLASSELSHAADSGKFGLSLGVLTDASGREWPAQQATILWNPDEIQIDQLAPLVGVGLRNLSLTLPQTGAPAAELELLADEAVFQINASPGFSAVSVDLREGSFDSRWLAERFALDFPVDAELRSWALNLDALLPTPHMATGSTQLSLGTIVAGDWTVAELSLDLGLQENQLNLTSSGRFADAGFSISAEASLTRGSDRFAIDQITGSYRVENVPALFKGLAERIEAIDPQAKVPQAVADGVFSVELENFNPRRASLELRVQPGDAEEASPLSVKARWQHGNILDADILLAGANAKTNFNLVDLSYSATAAFDGFRSSRIDPWLKIFRVENTAKVELSGAWSGSGSIQKSLHLGELSLAGLDLQLAERPPIKVEGVLSYDWPRGFSTELLKLSSQQQAITADFRMDDGILEIKDLLWRKDAVEMASGKAVLPIPEDFSKWRDALSEERRPLEVDLQTRTLALESLKEWVPAVASLDSRATGQVNLKISGTFAEPSIEASIEAKNLQATDQAELPPADLRISLTGSEKLLRLEGNATAPDVPAATFSASMPFQPVQWLKNPGSVLEEQITARADLPRLDLSRYAALVPAARSVRGVLTGNVQVAGTLNQPALIGLLELRDGSLEMRQAQITALSGISATVDFSPERVVLRELRAESAGGTLRGSGSLGLVEWKPGTMDFQLTGRHLPLARNDSMILRTHADLRLSGPFETAVLSGSITPVDSLFYRDIEILPIGVPFTTPSAAALPRIDAPANAAAQLPEPFASWALDVRLRTANPFLIRGNFAEGSVTGEVWVRGTLANPRPDGAVEISELRAALPFSTLTVRRGTLRFTPDTGFDPILEIRGTSNPRPYRVNGYVHGRLSDPQLVLTSSPPLPPNEIMTLLATGATTSGLENPQAAASRAIQLFAEELRRGRFVVGRQLRPLLGLFDRVDFAVSEADPYSNYSYSTAMLSLTDRWFLSAGIGEDGDSRFLAIWRLTFH